MNRLIKVMDERNKLFETLFSDVIERLAKKFKANYEIICSKDIDSFTKFHKWFAEHK
jgi:predicted CopG family antitoxin